MVDILWHENYDFIFLVENLLLCNSSTIKGPTGPALGLETVMGITFGERQI